VRASTPVTLTTIDKLSVVEASTCGSSRSTVRDVPVCHHQLKRRLPDTTDPGNKAFWLVY